MMLKKGIKKELNIFQKIKNIQKELPLIFLNLNSNKIQSKLPNEKRSLAKLKKLTLLMLGVTGSKYKANLAKEQETLMRLADLIIETYIAESALLKTEKLIKKNGLENCKTEIQMTQNYIQYSLRISKTSAEEIILSTTRGLRQSFLLSIINRLSMPLSYNFKNLRRNISERLEKDGKYTFSI